MSTNQEVEELSCRSYHKMMWTAAEDKRLKDAVEKCGTKNWNSIAAAIPGRNGKQCRERWACMLSPELSREAWTDEEDEMLIKLHEEHGNKWSYISNFLPGRSRINLRNRWSLLIRHDKVANASPLKKKGNRSFSLSNCNNSTICSISSTNCHISNQQLQKLKEEVLFSNKDNDLSSEIIFVNSDMSYEKNMNFPNTSSFICPCLAMNEKEMVVQRFANEDENLSSDDDCNNSSSSNHKSSAEDESDGTNSCSSSSSSSENDESDVYQKIDLIRWEDWDIDLSIQGQECITENAGHWY